MGSYHGKWSFDTFTHEKPVVVRDFSFIGDKIGLIRYPPYNKYKINFLSFMLWHWKKFKIFYFEYVPHAFCFLFGMLALVMMEFMYGDGVLLTTVVEFFKRAIGGSSE